MGFKRVEDIYAFQLSRAFKLEVYGLMRGSPQATRDLRFQSQIQEALAGAESNIDEGFRRWHAGVFAHFLGMAASSLGEGLRRLQDGIDRGYFKPDDCANAQTLGLRALKATTALATKERQRADENRRRKLRGRRRTKDEGPSTKGPKDPRT